MGDPNAGDDVPATRCDVLAGRCDTSCGLDAITVNAGVHSGSFLGAREPPSRWGLVEARTIRLYAVI